MLVYDGLDKLSLDNHSSFLKADPFKKVSLPKEANRKSQKLFPFVEMSENMEAYQYTFKSFNILRNLVSTCSSIFRYFILVIRGKGSEIHPDINLFDTYFKDVPRH